MTRIHMSEAVLPNPPHASSPLPPLHQMQHAKLLQKPFLQIKKQAQNEEGIYNVER